MKLQPAQPLMLTNRGCPLAFDVLDGDNPSGGIIGRATYEHWATAQGVIRYRIKVQSGGKELNGVLHIRHPRKF